jgi:hypothetical protein
MLTPAVPADWQEHQEQHPRQGLQEPTALVLVADQAVAVVVHLSHQVLQQVLAETAACAAAAVAEVALHTTLAREALVETAAQVIVWCSVGKKVNLCYS